MIKKVIFLDVDGVLNGERVILSSPDSRGFSHLDPISIGLVRQLCRTAEAKIVVSSTWRLDRDVIDKLLLAGFCHSEFHSDYKTERLDGIRGKEIALWLEQHPEVTQHVCLDDDSDFLPGQNLVQTDGINGISADNYYQALEFLEAKDKRGLRVASCARTSPTTKV
jgi:hypothetical protein